MKKIFFAVVCLYTAIEATAMPAFPRMTVPQLSAQQRMVQDFEQVLGEKLTHEQVAQLAYMTESFQTLRLHQNVSADTDVASYLACIGVKAGLILKGQGAICRDIDTGGIYSMMGWGVGMSLGAAARAFGAIVKHDRDLSLRGEFQGGELGGSEKGVSLLGNGPKVQGFFKSFGLDLAYFGGTQNRALFLIGLQYGAMVDLSYTKISIF